MRLGSWLTVLIAVAMAAHAQAGSVVSSVLTQAQLFTRSHPAMGTTYSLFIYANDEAQADREADRAFAIVDDVEALLSNYQEQSELSRINREAYAAAVTTDPETLSFLQSSLDWSARSEGAFDITVGALMKAWGFFRSTGHVPNEEELAVVRAKTGWRKVKLTAAARNVRFTAPGLELDPGGIGKGFAVDRVVELLRTDGIQAAMISAGSSTIYALGAPPGKAGWRIDVPDPTRHGEILSTVVLRDTSLSTASCSEKHFILAGHLYCHIMDPRLLRPVEGRLQATVISSSATDSDALSNAVFVDDDEARGRFMAGLEKSDAALVISGMNAFTSKPGGAEGMNSTPRRLRCNRYRWPSRVGISCEQSTRKPVTKQVVVKRKNE